IISSFESSSGEVFRPSRALIFLGVLIFLKGLVIVVGGWQIEKLQSYGLGVMSCFLAMLPGSPGCLIGMPIGLWTLLVLRRPEVRAAFSTDHPEQEAVTAQAADTPRSGMAAPRRKGFFRKMLATTTGWAMIFCVLGCLCSTFFPWVMDK